MSKIAILLATYNSQNYLDELLNSIINQTHNDWVLYIRDDGSDDNTLLIIDKYVKSYSNIVLLIDSVKGRGSKNSFLWMLQSVESEYYMFCDHDDIWLNEKISKTYQKMIEVEESNDKAPVIIHTDLIVVDEKLNKISPSFWKYSNIKPFYSSFNYYSAYNNVTGCTMMFNNVAKKISLDICPDAPMHDLWLALVVSLNNGIIKYVSEPLILYRQHGKNVLGAQKNPNVLNRLLIFGKVFESNKKLYKTVNFLKKTSYCKFIYNKIYFFLKNRSK